MHPAEAQLSIAEKLHIDQLCLMFEAAWKAGAARPQLDAYIANVTKTKRSELLRQLLLLDLDYRRRCGEVPDRDEYVALFPQDTSVIEQAFRASDTRAVTDSPAALGGNAEVEVSSDPLAGGLRTDDISAPEADSIPGYSIVREIHRGGQGVVYQALQKTTRRMVAIKVMREGPFAGRQDKARFEREVQVLAALKHPNIVAIHDSGSASGSFFFVMEYISGQPLDVYMAASRRSVRETLSLFQKICEAVNAAHLRGVIHRDLKPGNIRIDAEGEPQILDFGLAKVAPGDIGHESAAMTVTGQFVGSVPWASPEQAEGVPGKIDIRTDVYSLGVVLYQMLTAKFPYDVVGNFREVLDRIMTAVPVRPRSLRAEIDDEVETIVLKALAKERERRYQSAGELARDVGHYLAGEPIEAKADSTLYVLKKSLHRYRALVGAAAAIALILFGALVVSLSLWNRAEKAYVRERKQQELAVRRAREAEQARDLAREEKTRSDRLLYAEYIATARKHISDARFTSALQVLAECPAEQRQWEWGWLARLADVESFPRRRHEGPISASDISPDGRLVATGGDDGVARIWLLEKDTPEHVLHGDAQVRAVAFSPDGKLLAISGAGWFIRIWDVATGRLLRRFEAHKNWVHSLQFSPDGRLLVSGSADHTIRFWDVRTGAQAAEPLQHPDEIFSVALSPDERFLASVLMTQLATQSSLWIWDLDRRELQFTVPSIERQKLAFAPQGHTLAYAPRWNTIEFLDVESHTPLSSTVVPHKILGLAVSPDGKLVAAGCSDGAVLAWQAQANGAVTVLGEHDSSVSSVRFTRDGTHVISTGLDKTLRFWAVSAQHTIPKTLIREVGSQIETVTFSRCGRLLASGASLPGGREIVRVHEVATGALVREMAATTRINTVILHPDGRRVIAGTCGGAVHVWDFTNGRELQRLKSGDSQTRALALSPDGLLIVTAPTAHPSLPNPAFLWELETGRRLCELQDANQADTTSAIFSSDGKVVYTGRHGAVHAWETHTGRHLREIPLPPYRAAWTVSLSPEGRRLFVGHLEGNVHVVDLWDGTVSRTIRAHNGGSDMNGLALSPDGRRLATSAGTIVKIWDTASWRELMTLEEHTGIRTLAFSPDGRTLVSAGNGGLIMHPAYSWNDADYLGGPETTMADRIRQYGQQYRQHLPGDVLYTAPDPPTSPPVPSDRRADAAGRENRSVTTCGREAR
jgi:WD40 repeat protein/tRNA A-37 threonylcarbamoyl transferase component Bud32